MDLFIIILELIIADLILGGDNAIVISMATKNLPDEFRLKASLYGAALAILLRVVFIVLIMIFGEMHLILINLLAGLLLIKVAIDMINPKEEEHNVDASSNFAQAVKTIVIADAVMSFDNAIVIASIAQSAPVTNFMQIILVIGALLISFPIILFGARILTTIIDKFYFVVYIFGVMLIHIGLELISKDALFENLHFHLNANYESIMMWAFSVIITLVSIYLFKRSQTQTI